MTFQCVSRVSLNTGYKRSGYVRAAPHRIQKKMNMTSRFCHCAKTLANAKCYFDLGSQFSSCKQINTLTRFTALQACCLFGSVSKLAGCVATASDAHILQCLFCLTQDAVRASYVFIYLIIYLFFFGQNGCNVPNTISMPISCSAQRDISPPVPIC